MSTAGIDDIAACALRHLQAEGALREVDSAFAHLMQHTLHASAPVALAGALAMRAVSLGHSSFALGDAHRLLDALAVSTQLPETSGWADALAASPRVTTAEDALGDGVLIAFTQGRVALLRYARYEQRLAEHLYRHAQVPMDEDTEICSPEITETLRRLFPRDAEMSEDNGIDRQALAAAMALRNRLLLITGGPGTGKTTTVARLLATLIAAADTRAAPLRCALAAPTGRAAARLAEAIDSVLLRDVAAGRLDAGIAERIPRQARTLHRLLGWQPGRVAFRHDAQRPLQYDVIVIDEASMIDLPLMAKLVAAVPPEATLVLLGDPDQLPAVEAGDVLGGLCAACGDGLTVRTKDAAFVTDVLGTPVPTRDDPAPLAGARVHLLHGWRQVDAAALQALAQAMQAGDRDTVIARLRHQDDPSLVWRHGDTAALADTMRQDVLPAFEAIRDADDPQQALQRASVLRVLTALKRGPFGAEYWNAWCAAELGARAPYFHGRLVMVAANSERHGLYNGDLGVVWHDSDGTAAVWFDSANGLRAWRPAQLPAHVSAYATTVHKAQGSEFERILLILPDADARVLSRELLYTALTRARRSVQLWATPEALDRALARRTWRESGLEARLRMLAD